MLLCYYLLAFVLRGNVLRLLLLIKIIYRNYLKGILLQLKQPHEHEASSVDIEVREIVRAIKRRAEESPNAPPTQIFIDEVASVSNPEIIANLPQRNDLIRNINRIQNRNRPRNPLSLQDLSIQPPYSKTLNGEQFVQFDSGEQDQNRFIIFYTNRNFERLCNSRTLLCDGTFKTVPSQFYQLYTIHGSVLNYVFPLVYCIATRKTEDFYHNLLNHLSSRAQEMNLELNPQYILSDFEIAFMNAARNAFPNSQIKGCLFHFTQSIWRHTGYLKKIILTLKYVNADYFNADDFTVLRGLKQQYGENVNIRETIQKLLSLPFVPIDDVLNIFDEIVAEIPDDLEDEDALMDVVQYIERTYVRGRAARGRRPASAPRFPPNIWSVYDLTVNRQQRSTNSVEGFHSKFQRKILTHHAGIWKFLEFLQKDQKENEVCIIQLEAGHNRIRYPIKPGYKKNQEQIERIVGNYDTFRNEGNVMQYLMSISYRIKLNTVAETVEDNNDDEE